MKFLACQVIFWKLSFSFIRNIFVLISLFTDYTCLINCRLVYMKAMNRFNFILSFKVSLFLRFILLFFPLGTELFLLVSVCKLLTILLFFPLIIRVGLVKDTRLTLLERKFLMRHTMRMVLHCSASKALDQTICKRYKLNQYALIAFCSSAIYAYPLIFYSATHTNVQVYLCY